MRKRPRKYKKKYVPIWETKEIKLRDQTLLPLLSLQDGGIQRLLGEILRQSNALFGEKSPKQTKTRLLELTSLVKQLINEGVSPSWLLECLEYMVNNEAMIQLVRGRMVDEDIKRRGAFSRLKQMIDNEKPSSHLAHLWDPKAARKEGKRIIKAIRPSFISGRGHPSDSHNAFALLCLDMMLDKAIQEPEKRRLQLARLYMLVTGDMGDDSREVNNLRKEMVRQTLLRARKNKSLLKAIFKPTDWRNDLVPKKKDPPLSPKQELIERNFGLDPSC